MHSRAATLTSFDQPTRHPGGPTRFAALRVGALLVGVLALSACNDDGRTLRPARDDQTASVSTMPADTTAVPTSIPPETLPPLTVAPTTALPATSSPSNGGDESTTLSGEGGQQLTLSAPFADGTPMGITYTCDGLSVSPALTWSPAPAGTADIAVSMFDEQLPEFVHWVMSGLDPASTSLTQGEVPEFAIVGINGVEAPGYFGPCPPLGAQHRYRFTVHFLDQQTELGDGVPGADLLDFVKASTFASASVTGVYSRK